MENIPLGIPVNRIEWNLQLPWPMASRKRDVIVVLNIAAFLRRWVVRGEGFGSKFNLILLGKWPRRPPVVRRALLHGLFFVVYLSKCGLATFQSEATNRRYRVFFECKSSMLKRESWQTPYKTILFEAVLGKNSFEQTREMLRGRKAFSFLSISLLYPG